MSACKAQLKSICLWLAMTDSRLVVAALYYSLFLAVKLRAVFLAAHVWSTAFSLYGHLLVSGAGLVVMCSTLRGANPPLCSPGRLWRRASIAVAAAFQIIAMVTVWFTIHEADLKKATATSISGAELGLSFSMMAAIVVYVLVRCCLRACRNRLVPLGFNIQDQPDDDAEETYL